MTEKQLVYETLQLMPESATLAEILDELELLAALREGVAAADAGDLVDHATVVRESLAWITPSTGPAQP